jgi:excisionase family DNA binding protein
MFPKLLTIAEVAAILSVTTARAYELARTGVLPTVRLGRQVRIDEGRLLDWINAGGAALPGDLRR